jgi:hypothetical protein
MGIIEKTNAIVKIVKDLGNAELLSEIIDLKHEIVDIEEKNLSLRKENNDLKKAFEIKADLEFSDNAYWMKKEGGYDGPFCTGCWDDKHKLIRVTSEPKEVPSCPVCKRYVPEHICQPDFPDDKKEVNSKTPGPVVPRGKKTWDDY